MRPLHCDSIAERGGDSWRKQCALGWCTFVQFLEWSFSHDACLPNWHQDICKYYKSLAPAAVVSCMWLGLLLFKSSLMRRKLQRPPRHIARIIITVGIVLVTVLGCCMRSHFKFVAVGSPWVPGGDTHFHIYCTFIHIIAFYLYIHIACALQTLSINLQQQGNVTPF